MQTVENPKRVRYCCPMGYSEVDLKILSIDAYALPQHASKHLRSVILVSHLIGKRAVSPGKSNCVTFRKKAISELSAADHT